MNENTVLGKKVAAPEFYDPSILVRVDRQENRSQYNLSSKSLPFIGYDVFNAYEVSFLINNGFPLAYVAKIVYPAISRYLVESKSLKLYLNSFNMSKMGATAEEATSRVKFCIQADLTKLLEVDVKIEFFDEYSLFSSDKKVAKVFAGYQPIESHLYIMRDNPDYKLASFKEDPSVLQKHLKESASSKLLEFRFSCDLLRSNCKITHQPDFGTLFFYIKCNYNISMLDIFDYIVSFRQENHFHEEVVEMIFKRFFDTFKPSKLMVSAIYTRRGGIDICPCRATSEDLLDPALINVKVLCEKTLKQ